jgi:hypothetical protein
MKKDMEKPKSPIKIALIPKPLPVPKPKPTIQTKQEILNKENLIKQVPPPPPPQESKRKPLLYARVVAVNKYQHKYQPIDKEVWELMKEVKGAFPEKSMEEVREMVSPGNTNPTSKGHNQSSLKAQLAMGVWSKQKVMLVIAFDIAQFFPFLNHDIFLLIFDCFGFNDCVINFFSDYLVDRKTQYVINGKKSEPYDCTVGVGQGTCISSYMFDFTRKTAGAITAASGISFHSFPSNNSAS